jgi:hypothetical protein
MQRFRSSAAAVMLLASLSGCANSSGHGSLPRGIVFVRDLPADTPSSRRDPEHSRVYRDGRLVARIEGRFFAARDIAGNSLLYDYRQKTVRAFQGGPSWKFDPCPDPNGIRLLELSPDGRRGLCGFESSDGHRLVLFDPRFPARTRHVIFTNLSFNHLHRAAWIDNDRIALVEYRKGCPWHHYDAGRAGLVIIDVGGRVLERGPCMSGVLAGPHGLVYADYFANFWHFLDVFVDQPRDRIAFSTDRGHSWHIGRPQFVDGQGRIFSTGANSLDQTLFDESGAEVLGGVRKAQWAKP